MVFSQKVKHLIMAKKDTIGKSHSRGAERCNFQLPSTFQSKVMSAERNLIKTMYYSPPHFPPGLHCGAREACAAEGGGRLCLDLLPHPRQRGAQGSQSRAKSGGEGGGGGGGVEEEGRLLLFVSFVA